MPERESYDLGTPFLRLEREGHLAWCTIDRPASRNALSGAMYFGVKRAVQIVNAITDPTALLITGVGDVFAPGGELRGRAKIRIRSSSSSASPTCCRSRRCATALRPWFPR